MPADERKIKIESLKNCLRKFKEFDSSIRITGSKKELLERVYSQVQGPNAKSIPNAVYNANLALQQQQPPQQQPQQQNDFVFENYESNEIINPVDENQMDQQPMEE